MQNVAWLMVPEIALIGAVLWWTDWGPGSWIGKAHMQNGFIGRVFDERSNVVPVYSSPVCDSRVDAAAACFKARPNAAKCMVSEARYNEQLKATVATHRGIQWVPATAVLTTDIHRDTVRAL